MSQTKCNLLSAAGIAGGYLLIFLVGKLFANEPCPPYLVRLFRTDPTLHPYLFGWLISHGRMLCFAAISSFSALCGKSCFGWTTLSAFALGLPLGEFLGEVPNSYLHYGWVIFLLIFLSGSIMGIALEKFPNEKVSLRAKPFLLWLLIYALLIPASILWVRSQFPTA